MFLAWHGASSASRDLEFKLDAHRQSLAVEQKELVASLPDGDKGYRSGEYLERLRIDLRELVNRELTKSGTGEVDLAIKRAAIRDLLTRIEAYEKAYGGNQGVATTRWNVLTLDDLKTAEARLRTLLTELSAAAAKYSDSGRPLNLVGKVAEVRSELAGLQDELSSRDGSNPPRLIALRTDGKVTNKAAAALVARIEGGNSEKFAEYALRVEIEERMAWNSNDPSLRLVQKEVKKDRISRRMVGLLAVEGTRGWPPRRGPPPTGPPPPPDASGATASDRPRKPLPGGGALRTEVTSAASDLVLSKKKGDLRSSAEARARLQVTAQELAEGLGLSTKETSWRTALRAMSDKALLETEGSLREWQKALLTARDRLPAASFHGQHEIKETQVQLEALRRELLIRGIRGPPPPPSTEGPHGPKAVEEALKTNRIAGLNRNDELTHRFQVDRRSLVELQKVLETAPEAERPFLRQALRDQAVRSLVAEAEAMTELWKQAEEIERKSIIHGRGAAGAEAAQRASTAKVQLTQQALAIWKSAGQHHKDAFKSISQLWPQNHPLNQKPTPGASPSYKSNTLTNVSMKLRGAAALVQEEKLALPKKDVSVSALKNAPGSVSVDFSRAFPKEGMNTAADFRSKPRIAPGGVIVDVELPSDIAMRLSMVRYEKRERSFWIELDGQSLRVTPPVRPEIARAALGFVLDGRVVAVDITPITVHDIFWMAKEEAVDLSETDIRIQPDIGRKIRSALRYLRYVRINPAVANTEVATSLIEADEFIFEALSLGEILDASDVVFLGIDTTPLFQARKKAEERLKQELLASKGYKSLITIEAMSTSQKKQSIDLSPRVDYHVYAIPHRLDEVSKWFSQHGETLRSRSDAIRTLEEFSVAVAIFRTALSRNVFDDRITVGSLIDYSDRTSRFLCRSETKSVCRSGFLKRFLEYN